MRTSPLFRTIVVVVLLAGGLALRVQETVGMTDEEADFFADGCTADDGDVHYEFNVDGSVQSVTCTDSVSGNWTMESNPGTTGGGWTVTGTDASLHEVTIVVEDVILVSELPADAATPLTPVVADEPMLVEAVVTWNPSADSALEAGLVQVNACRMLGGTEIVTHPDGNPESTSFMVYCQDGLRDGMWCAFGIGLSTCFVLPGSVPEGNTTASDTVPAESTSAEDDTDPTPTATTQPTVIATATDPVPTPTVPSPDDPVIEPTAPPVEPTLPMFEQDPTPTPTPVILT